MSPKPIKILIATGIYPPDIGGPATYAKSLKDEFESLGFVVLVRHYHWEKKIPIILRHIFYFLRVCLVVPFVDHIIALDTFSVGWPTVWAGWLFGKKVVIRTGGDFLWESYVNRTKERLTLSSFYLKPQKFNFKEKIIFKLTKSTLHRTWKIVFSTKWQRDIWLSAYNLNSRQTEIIENFFKPKVTSGSSPLLSPPYKYLWAGRDIFIKNVDYLKLAFAKAQAQNPDLDLEIITNLPQAQLFEKLKNCHTVIVPSLSDISPNLVLEGLNLGKPFILTRETGILDRLQGLGLFVDPLSIEEISSAILELAKPEIYKNFQTAIANHQFVHSYRDISQEFVSLFERN